jgi:hypothetical protein
MQGLERAGRIESLSEPYYSVFKSVGRNCTCYLLLTMVTKLIGFPLTSMSEYGEQAQSVASISHGLHPAPTGLSLAGPAHATQLLFAFKEFGMGYPDSLQRRLLVICRG